MKVVVFSLGCKVNDYEGRAMIARIRSQGHEATDALEPADCYIINTCSVTGEADKKSRQAVARAKKQNPAAPVYVLGCSSQFDPRKYTAKSGVRQVWGTVDKAGFAERAVNDFLSKSNAHSENPRWDFPAEYEDNLSPFLTKTRAYIKIQDGCDSFCSYCIVPHLRGRSRSRSIDSILKEAHAAAADTKEIVFIGINVSAYGKDTGSGIAELATALGKISVRKRFGSLECGVISERVVKTLLDNGFCAHFHLSMQSGSDTVLKRMNRHYTAKEFIEKTEIIRRFAPESGITTDIIAGFPGETDSEHAQTLRTVETVRFSDAHIFPYSIREGTVAATMPQVPKDVIKARAAELAGVCKNHKEDFLRAQIGKKLQVYFEDEAGDGYCGGYSENYIRVYANATAGTIRNCTVKEIYKEGVLGENE